MSNLLNHQILHAAFFMPSPEGRTGLPILGWGEPGTGKTGFIKAESLASGLPFYRLSPAEAGEGQFGVVPVPMGDNYLHYPPPAWVKLLEKGGTLFVDEISTAPPALQAPLLGLVQFGVIGSYQLPSNVRIIGAANETQDAAGGWDMAPALANRFGHFDFEGLDVDAWVVGLIGGFNNERPAIDPVAEERRVAEAWPGAIAQARGLVAGFITRKRDMLHRRPGKGSAANNRAWASRRSVEYATYALASSMVHNLSEVDADTFMAAFVGAAWVQEFATWRVNADLPNPEDLLDGKVKWSHDPRRLDRTMAVLSSIAAFVTPEKATKREQRANVAWQILGTVIQDAPDLAIPAATAMRRATPLIIGAKYPAAQKVLSDLVPMMREAHLI